MGDSPPIKKWLNNQIRLLITTRLKFETDFCAQKKMKKTVWRNVLMEIKNVDPEFPFSLGEIIRKFLNIMVTYRRIKSRQKTSAESTTLWEFFDELDSEYGSKHSVSVPSTNIDFSVKVENVEEVGNEENDYVDDSTSDPPSKKSKNNEILEFLKQESEKYRGCFSKLIEIGNARLKVEEEKLEEMKELKNLLKQILD